MADISKQPPLPGRGVFGWLGRQVGHLARAIKTPAGDRTVYRSRKIEEAPHPEDPARTLRRTTTDEVIEHPR
jgi:hypothetical protein